MILYKKDSKNKIRSLQILADHGYLIQISGLVHGKKVEHSKLCTPKNIGRSNETDSCEQARIEAASLINKKIREGYRTSISEAENDVIILPMLAKDYNKEKHKINWSYPVYVQPKLDGMRAISLSDNKLISRTNKSIETLNHLNEEIRILREYGIDIPDGEVYAHGLTFQENMKLIKKYRPGKTEKVKFHIYDCISKEGFKERYTALQSAFKMNNFKYLELVPTNVISSEKELKAHHKIFLSEGYEGTIIRHGEEAYKINSRSSNLLKYKDFLDIQLPILDVIPDNADPLCGSCIFTWVGATGHRKGDNILGCGMKFSYKEREEILINKENYIGKTAELRFFEYSDSGVPRFPVVVGFNLDR